MRYNFRPFRPKLISTPKTPQDREKLIQSAKRKSRFHRHPKMGVSLSLVTPAYNSALFLDQYFWCLVTQTTGIENVQVILIDDGSTDATPDIIEAWRRHFPDLIINHRKENEGASVARNVGLDLATGDWVSLPDSDDFLGQTFFHQMNKEIAREHSAPLLFATAKLVMFREARRRFNTRHQLRYRFLKGRKIVKSDDMGENIVLHAAATFFRRKAIEDAKLRYDPRVRPTFEDGHFIYHLLLANPNSVCAFLPRAAYFYRKREGENSLVDGAYTKKEWYLDQLEFGPLDLARTAMEKLGKVPRFLQHALLYELKWRFQLILETPGLENALDASEKEKSWQLLQQNLSYIDMEAVETDWRPKLTNDVKFTISEILDPGGERDATITIFDYDRVAELVQIKYSARGRTRPLKILVDDQERAPKFPSKFHHVMLGHEAYSEHLAWFDLKQGETAKFLLEDRDCTLKRSALKIGNYGHPQLDDLVPPTRRRSFRGKTLYAKRLVRSKEFQEKFRGSWIFADREDRADDNAEHLYRYLMQNGLADNCYFLISKHARDWKRLEADGFNLISTRSDDHKAAMLHASIFASSHLEHSVLWPTDPRVIKQFGRYRLVFLQHGVTQNDLSLWFNKKNIDLLVTVTKDEQSFLADPQRNFVVSENQLKRTGFPRHDALLQRPENGGKILVMPTWRKYLADTPPPGPAGSPSNLAFQKMEFVAKWTSILRSDRLRTAAKSHDLGIVFCPHPNMIDHLKHIELPKDVEIWDLRQNESIQKLFAQTSLLLTDYSSTAFDVAILNRPVVYYQFDKEQFFSGDHMFEHGYYRHEEHGFGPVSQQEDEVLQFVEQALNGNEDDLYQRRRDETFDQRDGQNCKRVYEAIREIAC